MPTTGPVSPIRLMDALADADDRLVARLATLRPTEAWPPDLAPLVTQLIDQVTTHLHRERHLLLPCLRDVAQAAATGIPHPRCPYPTLAHPMRVMEEEHQAPLATLRQLHDRTTGYARPLDGLAGALTTLREVDAALREHVRMADHELFPRVLDLEAGLA